MSDTVIKKDHNQIHYTRPNRANIQWKFNILIVLIYEKIQIYIAKRLLRFNKKRNRNTNYYFPIKNLRKTKYFVIIVITII